jgi:hypothetical protein
MFLRSISSFSAVCLCIYLSVYIHLLNLGLFFSFLVPYTFCRIPWTWDEPVARPLLVHTITQTQNKRTQTSMFRVGFEHKITVFERTKKVHALDRPATVIGFQQTTRRHISNTFIAIAMTSSNRISRTN